MSRLSDEHHRDPLLPLRRQLQVSREALQAQEDDLHRRLEHHVARCAAHGADGPAAPILQAAAGPVV